MLNFVLSSVLSTSHPLSALVFVQTWAGIRSKGKSQLGSDSDRGSRTVLPIRVKCLIRKSPWDLPDSGFSWVKARYCFCPPIHPCFRRTHALLFLFSVTLINESFSKIKKINLETLFEFFILFLKYLLGQILEQDFVLVVLWTY